VCVWVWVCVGGWVWCGVCARMGVRVDVVGRWCECEVDLAVTHQNDMRRRNCSRWLIMWIAQKELINK